MAAGFKPLQRPAGGAARFAVRIRLALRAGYAVRALHLYRSNFTPSARLEKPYAMVCINIIAADSNRDAEFLFTSMQQAFVKLRRGETGQLPPPVENMHQLWSASEQYGVQQALRMSLVGDKTKVRHGLVSIMGNRGGRNHGQWPDLRPPRGCILSI